MKVKSLYHFYREHFNYPYRGRKYYGRAVSEASLLVKEALRKKSLIPIIKYCRMPYANPITLKMIDRFIGIVENSYPDLFEKVDYYEGYVLIDKRYLKTNHRCIEIPVSCGIERKANKLIFLIYGSAYDIIEENRVLISLIKEFPISSSLPVSVSRIEYWDLTKGNIKEIDASTLAPIDKESLIATANKL